MIQVTHEFHFRCPPAELFTALTDPAWKTRWDTEVIEERVEPRLQVGAKVHQRRRFMGREVEGVSVVTELVEGERYCGTSLPGERFSVSGRYQIRPTRQGSALLHEFSLGGLPRLMEPLARVGLEFSLRGRFARLATLLDSSTLT